MKTTSVEIKKTEYKKKPNEKPAPKPEPGTPPAGTPATAEKTGPVAQTLGILDGAHVKAIVKVPEEASGLRKGECITLKVDAGGARPMEFEVCNLGLEEREDEAKDVVGFYDKSVRHTEVNRKQLNAAKKTIGSFLGIVPKKVTHVLTGKDAKNPVLVYADNLGVMIAPRVEQSD